jgi:hypothetical protein
VDKAQGGQRVNPYETFPEKPISGPGPMKAAFLARGIQSFHAACAFVHGLPYGYNSDRDDPMILFKEGKGSCTTKHAVIAALALELGLPVAKHIGIYAMTEALVTGTQALLETFQLPYVPMVHCFLACNGNRNGKNRAIDAFLHTEAVAPHISAKEEYLRYRTALENLLATRDELRGVKLKTVLKVREMGLALLKANIGG